MPEATIYKERRVVPRIKVNIPIQYHLVEDKGTITTVKEHQKKTRGEKAIDVSLGGLQIQSTQALKTGDVLEMEITLPGLPLSLPAMAEVVWADQHGGGLHFLRMTDEDVQVLKAFLNKAMKTRGSV